LTLLEAKLPYLPIDVPSFRLDYNQYLLDVHPLGSPLVWAVSANRLDVVQGLLKLGADPFAGGSDSAIVLAVSGHKKEIIAEFLKHKEVQRRINEFNESSRTLVLFEALYCNRLDRRLITDGSQHESAELETIALLLRHGARVVAIYPDGDNAVQVASIFNYINTIKFLLDNGGDTLINTECTAHPER
jgi:ankyrin repeat protein